MKTDLNGNNQADHTIVSQTAEIDDVHLHYLTAGEGPPLILLHGYAETSRMWRPVMPALAERFAVIAPDLPGIGDSAIPESGLDMKTAALRIHALARSLGVEKAKVVGARHRPDGCLCLCGAVSRGNGEAGGDGCFSPRRGRMGGRL